MYINKIIYENVGPIQNLQIQFPFDQGNPKPVIFVGENGTGKSTVLSNIVDAFYEMAGTAFDNAQPAVGGYSHQYFKTISPVQIRSGQEYMFSYISFKGESTCNYICKSGNITVEDLKKKAIVSDDRINWKGNENYKKTTIDKEKAEKIWDSQVMCYFGPDRYERPAWMGDQYYRADENIHPTIHERYAGHLDKPITVKSVTTANLSWLLDVIADSRPDITINEDSLSLVNVSSNNLRLLAQARKNLEIILSNILGDEVYFALNYRNRHQDRFRIIRKRDNMVLAPSLDSLSTGQIALFNLFSTIVRYADSNDINKSVNLSDIEGIVVIDEIELHLHTKLQKEVLPELIKLFPKVQFIITTHAPLFLLGMKEILGESCFEIYELPEGTKISTERFTEFQNAYEYLKETETYQQDVQKALDAIQANGKTLIVTEGPSDWKHLKAAYNNLKSCEKYKTLFDNLEFGFLEYEPKDSYGNAEYKLEMGKDVLKNICENMAKIPQQNKYIFIADRDDEKINSIMTVPDKSYKDWGNNVFSFVLPVPQHRTETPAISIEHYYTDEEIKTEWEDPESGIIYRLYMGNEFDERGIAKDIDRFCEKRNKCGSTSIAIIEGSKGEKVTSINDNTVNNYAMPKTKFAMMVLNKQEPFDSFKFDSFVEIFKIIKEIIEDNSFNC